jgi:hypothetical protein
LQTLQAWSFARDQDEAQGRESCTGLRMDLYQSSAKALHEPPYKPLQKLYLKLYSKFYSKLYSKFYSKLYLKLCSKLY